MIHRFSRSGPDGPKQVSLRSDVEQQFPLTQVHDDASADHELAERLAAQVGYGSGALVYVYLRTDNANINKVFEADPDPTYWNKVEIKGFYDPPPPLQELKKWGVDIELKPEIYFPLSTLHEKCGRNLRSGDIIRIPGYEPVNNIENFRVISVAPDGQYRYKWYYLKCYTLNLTNDPSVQPDGGDSIPRELLDG